MFAILVSQMAFGQKLFSDFRYNLRVAGNIGGTAPVVMPATIRGLNSFKFRPNLSLGVDAIKPFNDKWSLILGLRTENKDMRIDGRVKTYHMEMVQGNETVEGYYTGCVVTNVRQKMISIPAVLSYKVNHDLNLKFGPYMSLLIEREFSGYAHDGYLRVGDPTGARVNVGEDEASKGSYDFSEYMRHTQYGLMAGADWFISKHWGLFGDLCWGMTGIHKGSFKTMDQTLYPIYATIGAIYRFKNR